MRLDQAIAELGSPRCQVFIVSDSKEPDDWPENPIDGLETARWADYEVSDPVAAGSHSVRYRSPQAEARFPDHRNVGIRVEYLIVGRQAADPPRP